MLRLRNDQVDLEKMPRLPAKINLDSRDKWKSILEEVEKKEIPVEVMERLTVNLTNGETFNINIREMLATGDDPTLVHAALQKKLDEMDEYIEDIDFHINIDAVVNTIQPVTDKILKNL